MKLLSFVTISLIFFVSVTVLSSCDSSLAVKIDSPQPKGEEVLLTIYRPYGFCWRLRHPYLYLNGIQIMQLQNNGYIQLLLKPGKHHIELKGTWEMQVASVEQTVQAGKEYYYKYDVGCFLGLFPVGFIELYEVPQKVAVSEIEGMTYQPSKVPPIEPKKTDEYLEGEATY
ncbi:DUF2846 domain-containing protein [Deltaproteobacteria bacterium TL4]